MDARVFRRLAAVIILCGIAAFAIKALITKVWVAGAELLSLRIRSPSQWPGTARSSASAWNWN